ncbi:hypothetical protein [Qaidamihabitans albus]|uniref:hypothetical protein n=1 Tax=Qaidamihabitans albus TaxID=2795733 RepID=UPI0018F1733A|nr:hypothetical protein [Qaidamihabitans albus]
MEREGLEGFYLRELGIDDYFRWKCVDIPGLWLNERHLGIAYKVGYTLAGRYAGVFDDSDFKYTGDDGKSYPRVLSAC